VDIIAAKSFIETFFHRNDASNRNCVISKFNRNLVLGYMTYGRMGPASRAFRQLRVLRPSLPDVWT